jgi:lysophospholipase L1-like esterase
MLRVATLVLLAAFLSACGNTPPAGPSDDRTVNNPPPGPTHSVGLVAFLDWDRDGVRSGSEMLLPGVELSLGQRRATADGFGRASIDGVSAGTFAVTFTPSTVPPFLTTLRDVTTTAPSGTDTYVPFAYPIGQNTPGRYMAFGDSIAGGDFSTDRSGYRARLGRKLGDFYRQPIGVEYGGNGGGRTEVGVELIEGALRRVRPAFTLVQFGVNDWASGACKPETCDAIPNLRQMLRSVKGNGSLPVVATLTPSNTGFDQRAPAERNDWVKAMNVQIKAMAPQEGALLVDVYAAFERTGNIRTYMSDHVHPNDAGYELIAQAFFETLTRPRGTGATSAAFASLPRLFDREG